MRHFLLLLVIGLVAVAAPVNSLQPLDEAMFAKTVAAAKGKVLLVNFWATWCEPCRKEMPELAKMAAALGPKGFSLVTISADDPDDEKNAIVFLQKAAIQGPAYLKKVKNDDKFIVSIDPKWSGALPALVLYDKTGKKVKTFVGETPLATVKAEVQKLL